jgi:hypothetical protein
MLLANRYRWHAADCMRVAQQINNPVEKALLMQMAETWTRLADRAEAIPDAVGGGNSSNESNGPHPQTNEKNGKPEGRKPGE